MSEHAVANAPDPTAGNSLRPAIALWLLIQILAIAIPALGVELSDQYPRPREKLAIDLAVVIQIIAGALLFDLLFRSPAQSIVVVAASGPIQILASVLSATPGRLAGLVCVYVALWLALLALWGWILSGKRARRLVGIVASTWAIMGAVLWYLRAEFGATSFGSSLNAALGPVVSAITLIHSRESAAIQFVPLVCAMTLTLAAASRQLIHRKFTAVRASVGESTV